ncbi:MAG: phosphatase PAP2 family protein [Gammaproteobacteria bacterium]
MSRLRNARHILFAAFGLIASLAGFEYTGADLRLAALVFDADAQQWIWSGSEPITRLLLYDGPKVILLAGLLVLVFSLLLGRFLPYMPKYARGVRIVLLSLIFVPASVSALKTMTNVACPKNVAEFGGDIAYVGTLHAYAADAKPALRQRCFPAAHASGGFALLALFFLFDTPRNRRRAICLGLGAGWIMGAYKMAIGDHFASHTVVSMLWAWLVINLIVTAENRFCRNRRDTAA